MWRCPSSQGSHHAHEQITQLHQVGFQSLESRPQPKRSQDSVALLLFAVLGIPSSEFPDSAKITASSAKSRSGTLTDFGPRLCLIFIPCRDKIAPQPHSWIKKAVGHTFHTVHRTRTQISRQFSNLCGNSMTTQRILECVPLHWIKCFLEINMLVVLYHGSASQEREVLGYGNLLTYQDCSGFRRFSKWWQTGISGKWASTMRGTLTGLVFSFLLWNSW